MSKPTLTAVFALALGGPVLAQEISNPAAPPTPVAGRGVPTIASVDRNGDGAVSRIEAARSKELVRQWESLDQNRDGQLDKGEFARLETESMRVPEGAGPDRAPGQPVTPVKPRR